MSHTQKSSVWEASYPAVFIYTILPPQRLADSSVCSSLPHLYGSMHEGPLQIKHSTEPDTKGMRVSLSHTHWFRWTHQLHATLKTAQAKMDDFWYISRVLLIESRDMKQPGHNKNLGFEKCSYDLIVKKENLA